VKRMMEICPGVYQVGGDHLSYPEDCCVYLLQDNDEAALIDTGAGPGAELVLNNITAAGVNLDTIRYIILTHGHIDHIGGVKYISERTIADIVAHELDLPAIEEGLPTLTAAPLYGIDYKGVKVDRVLHSDENLQLGKIKLHCIHTPGHTPGSISVNTDINGKRVLFGQDIHGPFSKQWGSDLKEWHQSMQKLLELRADILCEGHFGIYSPAAAVKKYIEGYIRQFS